MKSVKKTLGLVAVVTDLALSLTGCVSGVVDIDADIDHSGNIEAAAHFSRTFSVQEQVAIRVTGANGSVEIWGIPGADEVVVNAVRRVRSDSRLDAEEHLADVQVSAQKGPEEFEVRTIQPHHSHGRTYVVDYEITVPAELLAKVANGNGSILLDGLNADVDVTNGNGGVTLTDVRGSSWVSVGNGQIAATTYLPPGGQIVHAIGNGTLSLSVQPQVSASFSAKVGNGSISFSGLHLQQAVSGPRHLQGTLGSGQGLIDLSSGNGQIIVKGG
jgi:hypothetical protein